MEYVQLNEALTDAIQVTTHGNVAWDANNYCSAEALIKDGKAEQFRVVPLTETPAPAYDAITQSCIRDGCEKVEGQWQYKWRIDDLSAEQIAANQSAATQMFINATVVATQARLDDFAKTRNYDGILSAASYAVSSHPPFMTEGRYCADARDDTWGALYSLMAEVEAGTKPMPSSYADVEPLLPVLQWPE
jgi:hypothetical protein